MRKIICDKILRIIKTRKLLEQELNVKITNRGKEVFIDGKPTEEYLAELVIDALNFGFPFSVAVMIKEQNFAFEIISIKDYTNRKDLGRIRARIIGAKGKALKTLSNLTHCYLELKENHVGIIGPPELIERAQDAVVFIIQGAKHSNVYSYLEKHQVKPIYDLGLK